MRDYLSIICESQVVTYNNNIDYKINFQYKKNCSKPINNGQKYFEIYISFSIKQY